MREVKVGQKYRHFKGSLMEVIAIAYDSEKYSEEKKEESRVVVYKHINTGETWVRPYDMFNSKVDKEKYPNIEQEYRFEEYKIEK